MFLTKTLVVESISCLGSWEPNQLDTHVTSGLVSEREYVLCIPALLSLWLSTTMATAMKGAFLKSSSHATSTYFRAVSFHSTPVLDRKRRNFWDYGGDPSRKSSRRFNRKFRKVHAKETLLRNVGEYADYLFQSWKVDDGEPSSSTGTSGNKTQHWTNGTNINGSSPQGSQWETYRGRRGGFQFCNGDDEEVFRSAFGWERERVTYWSFFSDDYSQARNSSGHSNTHSSSGHSNTHRSSWNWRSRCEDDYETYEEYNDSSESNLTSDRLALGLSASGPLQLEDVKTAYRACALKWHPDRHQGSSKAVAEEKFKLCSAAYQSLCDKMD